jgi:hypothetical protein
MAATMPLEITFHGPFVFRFASDHAWAYAPKCDEHYLNILTDTEDVRLPLDKETNLPIRTFNLTGPQGGTTVQSGKKIMTHPWDLNKKGWPKTERHWQYVLSFPAPDSIFGLVPEYVWIYGYSPDGSSSANGKYDYYARALRFRYNNSDDPQFDEFKDNQIQFCAKHLGGNESGYSIEIRYSHYASVAKKKEEYYLDAQSCFENMREHLSPCDEWKAFFGEEPAKSKYHGPYSVFQASGPNGPHDCGAPVMALEDGISLNPNTQSKSSIPMSRRMVGKK